MTAFYVGQRVRVVGCCHPQRWGYCLGREAVVEDLECPTSSGPAIAVHILGVGSIRDDGRRFAFLQSHLEPIIDHGHEVTTWDECVWKPEHLREVLA